MNCESCRALLSQYVDGELAGAEVPSVERHLESCSACCEELGSYRELSQMLSTRTEPDPFFLSRFRARRDELLGGDGTWLFWKRLAVRLLPLATAALLAAAAVMLLSSERPGMQELEPQALGDGIIVISEDEPFQMLEIAFESLPEEER